MKLQTKTVHLSNYYPTSGYRITLDYATSTKTVPIESGTRVTYDLSNIVNELTTEYSTFTGDSVIFGNGLGIERAEFNYGDGNIDYVSTDLIYDNDLGKYTFKLPDTVSHDYILDSLSGKSDGTFTFYYRNGNKFEFTIKYLYTLKNTIDMNLMTLSNNSFVALSADTLISMVDDNNTYFNSIISNSDNLIISDPYRANLIDNDGIWIIRDTGTDLDPVLTDDQQKIYILFF